MEAIRKMLNIVHYSQGQITIALPPLHHLSCALWDIHGSKLAAVISHLMDYLGLLVSVFLWSVSQEAMGSFSSAKTQET